MNLTKDDLIAIGKGLVIAVIGAALTYLSTFIAGHDFGSWTPLVVALWGVIVNIIRKWIDEPVAKATGVQL